MMNGKFAGYQNLEELKAFFPIDISAGEATPDLDLAPAGEILVIFQDAGENRLAKFHWGLVPSWAKDVSIGNRLINARAETIAEKPAFREAFRRRRCLIPAAGFFEWQGHAGSRQPMFVTLPDRKPFAFAGLWDTWQSGRGAGTRYRSCTIITTRASRSFSAVHHRMPVILKPQVYDQWLDTQYQNPLALADLLKNAIITELESRPLPQRTGAARQIDPSRAEAAGKARQTNFVWPERKE